MKNINFKSLMLVLTVILAGLISACSSSPQNQAGIDNPFTAGDERRFGGLDQKQLYDGARSALDSNDYSTALDFYNRLEALYPFTPHARQAQLETIYTNYRWNRYESTIALADRFIKQHPRHPDIDYVYYIRGLANFDRTFDQGGDIFSGREETRDPGFAQAAFASFSQMIRSFPSSPYAPDARQRLIFLKQRLAEYELSIADYYLGRGAWMAAANRSKNIITNYQGTPAIPEALVIQQKAYTKLGLNDLARNANAVLKLNYPNYQGRPSGSFLSSLNPFSDSNDVPEAPAYSPPVSRPKQPSAASLEQAYPSGTPEADLDQYSPSADAQLDALEEKATIETKAQEPVQELIEEDRAAEQQRIESNRERQERLWQEKMAEERRKQRAVPLPTTNNTESEQISDEKLDEILEDVSE